ncbi:RagB/SusD family nutrient uptake outer membrane protein [Pedobacter endophyticus]|uniref:RagB/SusD family nutrient uptake outer membrane protein n=1 Tax=Pedobacter endophyticus TaxID=2789740 RepID=A0A7S9KYA8_9SPHI|nr:RagB/SusD family nutrient uptake outer membrane protein [Pedobacter endophyticus]QPH39088.1 RagB/SusD family nutrient uptake outer membrane protein [Pedobacter endophyticus]
MKNKIFLMAIVGMLACTSSCKKALELYTADQITSNIMWTTENLVDQGVIGVYYSLQRPVNSSGIVGESLQIGYYGYEAYGMNPNNSTFSFQWKWLFDGIHRANDAIVNIPNAPINDEKKRRLLAECKVLRAFFYMRLNELYGRDGLGVPIYAVPIAPSEANKGQSPEAEVWAFIIQDLTDAINEAALPNNQIQGQGRMSKGAAYALRGRSYLLSKKYDLAVADFAKVGEMGYSLFPNYKQLFKLANERCQEMILSVQYIEDPSGYGSRLQKFCAANQQGSKDSRGCWTDLQVTPALVNLYEVVVDANTVKPFDWADFIPEWNAVSASGTPNRKVFFLRDRKVNGADIHASISNSINTELNKIPTAKDLYLAEGNEARLKRAYQNRDPRLAYNVITPYADFQGVNSNSTAEGMYTFRYPVPAAYYFDQSSAEPNLNKNLPSTYFTTGNAGNRNEFKYIHRKFVGEGLEFARRQDNPIDEPIIRYADVVLMWAEALVEMGNLSGAMAQVKRVRDRAGIITMPSSFSSQTTARNYVRDERRREFVGEGVNFFDEMRWKTLKETKFSEKFAQPVWGGTGGTESTGGTTYEWIGDFWYTWPVPKAEIELNKNLKPTPGWVY